MLPELPVEAGSVPLLLASGSPHRAALLQRLGLAVSRFAPAVDETPQAGENARDLVLRLGEAKARAGLAARPGSIAIGSDQSATLDACTDAELRLEKPGDAAGARFQLARLSGRSVDFFTSLVVVDGQGGRIGAAPHVYRHVDRTRVSLRALEADEIARYVAAEAPWDCAGSFRVEALGIALFDAVESRDPTALVGLPLIALAAILRECGIRVP